MGCTNCSFPARSAHVEDWSDLVEGSTVEARITGANTGGLECKVGSIRGFIPASQVAVFRVEDYAEFLEQKLLCVVTEVNPRRKNLVLSRRAVLEREKEEARQQKLASLEVGQVAEGVVRKFMDFGAFVDIGGIDGLVHISQLSWDHINHPSEVLQEGQKIRVKIEKIDPQTGKIGLSHRDMLEHPWHHIRREVPGRFGRERDGFANREVRRLRQVGTRHRRAGAHFGIVALPRAERRQRREGRAGGPGQGPLGGRGVAAHCPVDEGRAARAGGRRAGGGEAAVEKPSRLANRWSQTPAAAARRHGSGHRRRPVRTQVVNAAAVGCRAGAMDRVGPVLIDRMGESPIVWPPAWMARNVLTKRGQETETLDINEMGSSGHE